MKILSAEQTRRADQYTIENEPISSIDLMERASVSFSVSFQSKFNNDHSIHIFCGTGNNGGDGLAVGRILETNGYDVDIYVIGSTEKGSADFNTNLIRLGSDHHRLHSQEQFPELGPSDVIIDAIFGSGLTRELGGLHAQLIDHLNNQKASRISIDIPSGLFADQLSSGVIFKADHSVSFQLPKLAFMFPENHQYVGDWEIADIGLSTEFIKHELTATYFVDIIEVESRIQPRSKFDHKGTFGKALIVAGSRGKMGAAVLSGGAALRSGLGLLTMHVPACGLNIMQTSLPEAMVNVDNSDYAISNLVGVDNYSVVGMGPGLGKDKVTCQMLAKFLESYQGSLVLDADALNIISENRQLLQLLPENTIMTPHPAEFKRLVGDWSDDFDRLEKQKEFSSDFKVIIVLKGAHSAITSPEGKVFFNSTGNPGMGTAGSGDVLTGVITALAAGQYSPLDAAIIGTFMHGLAGDLSAEEMGQTGLIAGDIIDYLPKAFKIFDK